MGMSTDDTPGSSGDIYQSRLDLEKLLRGHLREIVETWHRVRTPRGKTMEEIKAWLETNVQHRYWWDETNVTGTMDALWIEDRDDLVYYQMVWEEFL